MLLISTEIGRSILSEKINMFELLSKDEVNLFVIVFGTFGFLIVLLLSMLIKDNIKHKKKKEIYVKNKRTRTSIT